MATNEEVGRRIREAREELGLSQGALARLLTPPRTHAAISDIERGKTHLDIEDLSLFSSLLKKDLSYFYEGSRATTSVEYRRGDRGITLEEQHFADRNIEAFKQVARQRSAMQAKKKDE